MPRTPVIPVETLQDMAQRTFRGIRESVDAYMRDGDGDAFHRRQIALWDAAATDWRVNGAVLAMLRDDLPDFTAYVEAPAKEPKHWRMVGRATARNAVARRAA